MAIEVNNSQEFEKEVINSEKVVIVDFWATWCGPCKMFKPIFEKTSEEYTDVVFVKVNVDDAGDVAQKYNIRSIPTILMFKNGEVIAENHGMMPPAKLKEFVDANK